MYMFAEPETMTIIAGYIGFFLLGMACLALGQFFSVLTENQIVAALITVAVLLGFWFIGNLQSFQSSYFLWNLFGFLSFSGHYGQFIQGLVSTDAVAYYAVVSLIALSLNTAYLQWRR
jgi:ABC-2 type transport system permease protein